MTDDIGQLHRVEGLDNGLFDRFLVASFSWWDEQLVPADVEIRPEGGLPQEMRPRPPHRREIYALKVTGRDARH
jgi:hypothetical protein